MEAQFRTNKPEGRINRRLDRILGFRVLLHRKAAKSLKKLQGSIGSRILESLKKLESWPEKGDQLKPSRFWRLRVGDCRVIYEIDRQAKRVIVLHIGHRKNVYDEFTRLV